MDEQLKFHGFGLGIGNYSNITRKLFAEALTDNRGFRGHNEELH